MGNALLIGRKNNPSNKAFSVWCEAMGFGDIASGDRADAMWFASYPLGKTELPAGLTHPKHIRQWFRDQAPAPTPELSLDTPEPSVNLEAVAKQARKINALANSAAAGDETAKLY